MLNTAVDDKGQQSVLSLLLLDAMSQHIIAFITTDEVDSSNQLAIDAGDAVCQNVTGRVQRPTFKSI